MQVTKIGKSLRRARMLRNETLFDMANNLGVKTSELSGAEFGRNKLCESALLILQQEYQITIVYT